MSRAIVIIPARMASSRLPGKPLADIEGTPMVVHVLRRAEAAEIGPVVVAAAEPEIVDAVRAAGGRAVATRPDHTSGSDRVFEALQAVDPDGTYDAAINLQGDLPAIAPAAVGAVLQPLSDPAVDIATLAAPIAEPGEREDSNVVKAVLALEPGASVGRALYFSRAPVPAGEGPFYHHIGVYGFRRDALARYVALPPSVLERREKLEQLRALEAGMRIAVALVDTVPLGVDTPADLARIRAIMAAEPA